MCDPVTITVVTLAVASSVATIAQQQQAADTQNEYQELLYGQRREAALENFAQLREREFEQRALAAQDIQAVTRQARQASAAAKLQGLEAGVGGASFNVLLREFERSELENVGVVQQNLSFVQRQLREQARAAGRIEGPTPFFGPLDSPLGIIASGLQVASAGFSAGQATRPKV